MQMVQGLVAETIEDGRSAEEIKQAKLLDEYSDWGAGYVSSDRFIDIVVRDQAL